MIGDSFVFGARAAIVADSGLSLAGSHLNVPGFGEHPPVVSGNTTMNVLTYLKQYVEQIQALPGPVMVYLTIGTVDEAMGYLSAQVGGNIDTIVSTVLDSRPGVTIVHAGYSFDDQFTSGWLPYMQSAGRFPDRYAYVGLYAIDDQIERAAQPDGHPTAAGYATRAAYVRANAALTPAMADWPQASVGSCP